MFSSAKGLLPCFVSLSILRCALVCSAQSSLPPSWAYSSYFGGSQSDGITATALDASGNVYVAGTSASPDFPTTAGVYEPHYPGPSGATVVFVAKFSPLGALVWSTFLGPGTTNFAVPSGIAVDSGQNVYVSGVFQSPGFPTTPGLPRDGDVFVSKLNSTGSQLVYSGKMGINSDEAASQIVLDSSDDAFIIGSGVTGSCCDNRTGIIGPLGGIGDFWVAEIPASGIGVPWSVQIGGSGLDNANSMAIDSAGKLYITGYSDSSNFPVTAGAVNQAGIGRTFVVKLDPTLPPSSSEIYGALVGNTGSSNGYIEGESIAVDQSGEAFVGAWTYNIGMFTSAWAFQTQAQTVPNAYVFELNSAGSAVTNGTYLGGGAADYVGEVSVDAAGNTYVSGFTFSWDFLTSAYGDPPIPLNMEQAYYVKLNPAFAAISSVAFGGLYGTQSSASAADGTGGLWVTGYAANDFPTTPNAYQQVFGGDYDGVLVHTNFYPLCDGNGGVAICTLATNGNNSERIEFAAQSANLEDAADISLNIDGMFAYSLHAAQFDTWLPIAPGNHTATVLALHTDGSQAKTQLQFNVTAASACPLNPIAPSLTLCSPLNAAVVKGPLTIVAQANDGVPPKSVQLFVDGVLQTTIQGNNGAYTYTLQLAAGVHRVSVQGVDSNRDYSATTAVVRITE